MLLVRAFWFGILLSEIDNVVGYYSYRLLRDFSSKSTPLQLNCSYGVPIPPFTIDKSFTRDEEKQVLKRFYDETSGYNWTIQRPGWTPYDNGTEIDHCHWAGVTCDKKSGYVIGLCLNKNNLHGRVPNFLWKLRNLMLLCLPDNPSLEGELKDFVFQNMSKLLRIDLAFCSLSGVLPNDLFSSLKSLVKIQLCCQISKTRIYGSIPQSITDLKELRVLSIGENGLSGPIPQTMGKLTKVWFLDLEFMPSLSGNINVFFGMKSLIYMHLTHAGIYGEFPDNFGSYFPQMKECQLGNNSIYSFIPPSVNKMKHLTKLILCGNGLGGKIPKELGELPSLRILDLSYNSQLQGMEVELNFHDSLNLEILVLRNNPRITMLFEDLVSKLAPKDPEQNPSPLRVLDISYCDFTGTISPMIWTFSNLIELNLKHNNISGSIPAVIDDLMFLSYADFSENPKLKGAIPNNFVLLQSLRVFDIRGNPLMRAPVGSVNQTNGIIQKIMRIDSNSRIKRENYNCPLVKLLSNDGRILLDPGYYYRKFCVCEDGFFGYLGHCKKCISGGSCSSKTLQFLDPRISLNIQKGYWPSPSSDNVLHLIRCPGRLDIAGEHLACNPKGECKCWVNTSTPDRRTVCDTSCTCQDGNTGRVCSKCAKNYFKTGYLCTECFKPSHPYLGVIPLVIVFLLSWLGLTMFCPSKHIKGKIPIAVTEFSILLTLRAFEVISGWIFEVSILVVVFYVAGIMENRRGIVTMFVFHFQVLDAIISETETPFPPFVYSIQNYMGSIFNLNFLEISCSIHMLFTPLGKYLVVFLFPLGCLSLIWIYYGIRWAFTTIRRRNGEQTEQQPPVLEQIRFQCLKVSITCLILTYFPVMKHTLAVISPCEFDADSAGSFMRYTQWIRCDTSDSTYETLQVLGWMAIIIYGVFEPVALLALLRWWKKSPASPQEKEKYFDTWLGSIYLPYKDKVRAYFEVVKLSRKFLIAFLLTFIPNTSSIQTFTIALVLMIAVIYQIKVEPYAKHEGGNFENFLEPLSLITLQQSVILLRFASYDSQMGMILIVLVANALVLIAFMVALLSVLINVFFANIPRSDERSPLLQEGVSQQPNRSPPTDSVPS